ncbi:MAG: leucine-rich repeat domain-containing protein [Clostridia bacterium]|nr:leucine-rich repeat domain-containing protein [Clostridia bacterium]
MKRLSLMLLLIGCLFTATAVSEGFLSFKLNRPYYDVGDTLWISGSGAGQPVTLELYREGDPASVIASGEALVREDGSFVGQLPLDLEGVYEARVSMSGESASQGPVFVYGAASEQAPEVHHKIENDTLVLSGESTATDLRWVRIWALDADGQQVYSTSRPVDQDGSFSFRYHPSSGGVYTLYAVLFDEFTMGRYSAPSSVTGRLKGTDVAEDEITFSLPEELPAFTDAVLETGVSGLETDLFRGDTEETWIAHLTADANGTIRVSGEILTEGQYCLSAGGARSTFSVVPREERPAAPDMDILYPGDVIYPREAFTISLKDAWDQAVIDLLDAEGNPIPSGRIEMKQASVEIAMDPAGTYALTARGARDGVWSDISAPVTFEVTDVPEDGVLSIISPEEIQTGENLSVYCLLPKMAGNVSLQVLSLTEDYCETYETSATEEGFCSFYLDAESAERRGKTLLPGTYRLSVTYAPEDGDAETKALDLQVTGERLTAPTLSTLNLTFAAGDTLVVEGLSGDADRISLRLTGKTVDGSDAPGTVLDVQPSDGTYTAEIVFTESGIWTIEAKGTLSGTRLTGVTEKRTILVTDECTAPAPLLELPEDTYAAGSWIRIPVDGPVQGEVRDKVGHTLLRLSEDSGEVHFALQSGGDYILYLWRTSMLSSPAVLPLHVDGEELQEPVSFDVTLPETLTGFQDVSLTLQSEAPDAVYHVRLMDGISGDLLFEASADVSVLIPGYALPGDTPLTLAVTASAPGLADAEKRFRLIPEGGEAITAPEALDIDRTKEALSMHLRERYDAISVLLETEAGRTASYAWEAPNDFLEIPELPFSPEHPLKVTVRGKKGDTWSLPGVFLAEAVSAGTPPLEILDMPAEAVLFEDLSIDVLNVEGITAYTAELFTVLDGRRVSDASETVYTANTENAGDTVSLYLSSWTKEAAAGSAVLRIYAEAEGQTIAETEANLTLTESPRPRILRTDTYSESGSSVVLRLDSTFEIIDVTVRDGDGFVHAAVENTDRVYLDLPEGTFIAAVQVFDGRAWSLPKTVTLISANIPGPEYREAAHQADIPEEKQIPAETIDLGFLPATVTTGECNVQIPLPEGTIRAWYTLLDESGREWETKRVPDSGSISLNTDLLDPGEYVLSVTATTEVGEAISSRTFTFETDRPQAPQVSVRDIAAPIHSVMVLDVTAPGATALSIHRDDAWWDTYEMAATGDVTRVPLSMDFGGEASFRVRAMTDGTWSCWSEPVSLRSYGDKDPAKLQVTFPEEIYEPIDVSAEQAEDLVLTLTRDGQVLYTQHIQEGSYILPTPLFSEGGTYTVSVQAFGDGSAKSILQEAAYDIFPQEADAEPWSLQDLSISFGERVELEFPTDASAALLQAYDENTPGRVTLLGEEDGRVWLDALPAGEHHFRLAVLSEGAWSFWSEPFTVRAGEPELQLASPAVTHPSTISSSSLLDISWDEIEGAEAYLVTLTPVLGGQALELRSSECEVQVLEDTLAPGWWRLKVTALAPAAEPGESLIHALLVTPGQHEVGHLPRSILAVEEKAFLGSAVSSVNVPRGCESIGSRAFAECRNLQTVFIPSTVREIAEDAFEGSTLVTLRVTEGSYGEAYALEHGLLYQFE